MKKYHKGPLVWSKSKIKSEADDAGRQWGIINGSVYDLTDYFYTVRILPCPPLLSQSSLSSPRRSTNSSLAPHTTSSTRRFQQSGKLSPEPT